MLLHKNESSLEKQQFHDRIFFQPNRNPVRKRKVCKTKVVIQNSSIKCYHEFHVRSLGMLILAALFLLLTKVILKLPYVKLKVQFSGG